MAKNFDEFENWLYSNDGWKKWDEKKAEIDKNRRRGVWVDQTPQISQDEHRLMFILREYHKQLRS